MKNNIIKFCPSHGFFVILKGNMELVEGDNVSQSGCMVHVAG